MNNKLSSQDPALSIIMAVFNSGKYLQTALESIASQTFKSKEIVFIDCCSTDNTMVLINKFAESNNCKILSEPDKGIYDAMNKGIKLAVGNWLYFLGSDDSFCSENTLAEIFTEISKTDTDLIYGNVIGQVTQTEYLHNNNEQVLLKGIHHQSIFYKKSVFNILGKYDLRFKIAADYHFTLKVFLNNKYIKQYANINIAYFGERGLSSNEYDYTFYSYHYKLIAANNGLSLLTDPVSCLNKSIYCCLILAKEKKEMLFAWRNLIFYIFQKNHLSLSFRALTLFRMLKWSLYF